MKCAVIREVGLRDGLQMVAAKLSTQHKLEWIDDAVAAGFHEIEVTSFVPHRTFPNFADATEVADAALKTHELSPSALVLNLRGARDAFRSGLRRVNYVISASEAHSRANARRTTDEALLEFGHIVALRDELGLEDDVALICGIASAFGCSLQGDVPLDRVIAISVQLAQFGASEIMLADTVGYAFPGQVERAFDTLQPRLPGVTLSAHFHDTRGLGLTNVAAALRTGIRRFDASIGGLGGCPYAPGATGNFNVEDAVFLLESEGFATGINIDRLFELRRKVESWLPDEQFAGSIARAGVPINASVLKEQAQCNTA